MRRRLYFLVPQLAEATRIFDSLLVKRVPINHLHLLAKDGVSLGDLPPATVIQKFDVIHSMLLGMGIGAVIGIITGLIVYQMMDLSIDGWILAATFVGAIGGGWSASMIGLMVPNSHLKYFQKAIDDGQYLLLVDVPKERVKEIEDYVHQLDPKIIYQGVEPTIPGFP